VTAAQRLTDAQRARFRRDGFLFYPDLLTGDEVARLVARSDDVAHGRIVYEPRFRGETILKQEAVVSAGAVVAANPLDGLRKIDHLAFYDDVFAARAASPTITGVVAELLGAPDLKLLSDQIFVKPPYHGSAKDWHQDAASWPWIVPQAWVTCWIALEDATVHNGCLRYLPGSHRFGLLQPHHLQRLVAEADVLKDEVAVEVPRGGCLFHHSLAFHYSGPNTTASRRRGWALHYVPATARDLSFPDEGTGMPGRGEYLQVRGHSHPGCV
jgi:ectoine hydroxylase-related dioxygenase (phytanoyl-CoA dioxygenase family)